ncbi:MAG: GNAT family N-acetyltransferase [Bacteroidales bacterium]|jgi:ribosomal protein S18 acetylase RimI-like enzyme|nr:GNAT family N-acetyltransferase [Bacteroidales bacterium]
MIRSATKQDISDIRKIYRKCFDTSEKYIDFFLKKCTPRHTLVYERDGKAVSVVQTMSISYISSSRTRGHRDSHAGVYICGLATLPAYRNRGYAKSLIAYIRNNAKRQGWKFMMVHPSNANIVSFYEKIGFNTPIYRNADSLPLFENRAFISHFDGANLFLTRDERLMSDYFQWNHYLLDYIIEEATFNPRSPFQYDTRYPYLLLTSLNDNFSIESTHSTFSFPL